MSFDYEDKKSKGGRKWVPERGGPAEAEAATGDGCWVHLGCVQLQAWRRKGGRERASRWRQGSVGWAVSCSRVRSASASLHRIEQASDRFLPRMSSSQKRG